jgi:hypothetical protein
MNSLNNYHLQEKVIEFITNGTTNYVELIV